MQIKTISFLFFLATFFFFNFNSLLAATYYVDCNHPSANDQNPGTLNLPWLTIQHAAETLIAGDTVLIREGVYNEIVYTTQDGNISDGYIVFSAYQNEIPVSPAQLGDLILVKRQYLWSQHVAAWRAGNMNRDFLRQMGILTP